MTLKNELPTPALLDWVRTDTILISNQFIKEFRELGTGPSGEPFTEADQALLRDLASAIANNTMREFKQQHT